MNSIEHNTEQMITDVQPINSARVEFAKMFASGTSSDTHLVPNAVTRLISRQRNLINQRGENHCYKTAKLSYHTRLKIMDPTFKLLGRAYSYQTTFMFLN